jgi:protease-4
MKINSYSNIFSGTWLLDPSFAPELEKMANNLMNGVVGNPFDRQEFFAAASSTSGSPGQPTQEKRIIKIPMRGLLPAYGNYYTVGADDYLEFFRMVNNNDSISAVVLDMNGPGSSIDAINMIREFSEEKKKPFVGLLNTCCSGHLWTAALLCDHRMAYGNISPNIGSVGILTNVYDDREAMKDAGYKVHIVRAPQSTTKGQMMVDYYAGKDKEFIEALEKEMEPMADYFIGDMKSLIPKLDHSAPGLFTGSTFNANDALKYGLIHSIGNEKKAFQVAQALAELNEN